MQRNAIILVTFQRFYDLKMSVTRIDEVKLCAQVKIETRLQGHVRAPSKAREL